MRRLRGEEEGLNIRVRWDERDLAVNHLCRTHQAPGGVLARAGILARMGRAWTGGKFTVVC